MATQVQFRRGSTSEHSSFTGAVGEVTVDTDLDTIRVHDGSIAGGVRIAKFSELNSPFTLSDSSSNTISVTPGDSDITLKGNGITTSVAGNSVTFALDNVVNLTNISSLDSTGVTINDNLLITGVIKAEGSSSIQIEDGLNISGATFSAGAISSNAGISGTTISGTTVTGTAFTMTSGFTATQSSGDVTVANTTSDKDLIFTVNDGGAATEVFRLDGDVSALLIASGKELRFADSGEKIASDGTDLTISSGAKINLTATSDVHIPNAVGLVFGDGGEHIETDNTNLTLTSGGTIIADCTSLVTTTLDVNIIQSTDSAEILINEALRVTGTITGTVTSAQYADLAEIFPTDETDLESGDVVHFTGNKKVGKCNEDAHSSVAGVISTEPGFLLNEGAVGVKLAMTGRVPCKVTGTINPGDLLVSAGNGRARAEANPSIGTVIGKALESKDTAGDAVIDIMITMM